MLQHARRGQRNELPYLHNPDQRRTFTSLQLVFTSIYSTSTRRLLPFGVTAHKLVTAVKAWYVTLSPFTPIGCKNSSLLKMQVFSINANESSANTFAAFQAKAIQINGTSSNSSNTTSSDSSDALSTVSLNRSAAIALAIGGVLAGMLL